MSDAADFRVSRNLIVAPRRDLCFDFVNTLVWRGSAPAESLHTIADLLDWLAAASAMPERAIGELSKWFTAHPAQAATVFSTALEIRETLYRLLRAVATASPPARADLRRLNNALNDTAPRATLEGADNRFGWRIEARPTATGILAPVLWSAADIIVGTDAARVRQCDNDRCLWLFLDDSKNGTRRWCSMQACGNRAKAHRHYLRQKGQ
jgi:predicted RNA-binding Zn ribbon-like protein